MARRANLSYSLREIAERFGGDIVGDAARRISRIASLENATADSITFVSNDRFVSQLSVTRAGAVILGAAHRDMTVLPRIVCKNPYAYFARVSALLHTEEMPKPGVHPLAAVDASAEIGANAYIGPYAVVSRDAHVGAGACVGAGCYVGEETSIGNDTQLHANVTIYHGCRIGARTTVHSGVIIGADGFGIAMDEGRWVKVPQVGGVVIGNDVEIGANTTIDRGAIDDTVIEDGVKLDNLIQIAHNVKVGAHTAIAACAGVAGSARIGKYCLIGGSSGIAGHTTIADHVEISAHTLVTKSILEPGTYSGAYPFDTNREWRRNAAQLRHLDKLVRSVKSLEERLAQLERKPS